MGKESHQSTIELNGMRYNAQTGKVLDGFKRAGQSIKMAPATLAAHPLVHRTAPASKKIHKSPQPSRTLMRHAVKKPSTITTRQTVAMDVVQHKSSSATATTFHAVDKTRIHRAASVSKNALVSRFGDMKTATNSKPLFNTPYSFPKPTVQVTPAKVQTPVAPAKESSATAKLLEKGMRNADSHAKPVKLKKTKLHHRVGKRLGLSQRTASIAASTLAVAAFGAFFAYQNMPNLNVRYAAAKSGVRASIPGYQPSGFAINSKVQYVPGTITITYRANADSRSYALTQKNTAWNSQALKDHLSAATGNIPQTYPDGGRTIYLHDNAADWVNNGVWYSISGDASLNTDQLIKIATSI